MDCQRRSSATSGGGLRCRTRCPRPCRGCLSIAGPYEIWRGRVIIRLWRSSNQGSYGLGTHLYGQTRETERTIAEMHGGGARLAGCLQVHTCRRHKPDREDASRNDRLLGRGDRQDVGMARLFQNDGTKKATTGTKTSSELSEQQEKSGRFLSLDCTTVYVVRGGTNPPRIVNTRVKVERIN